ncbi:hypothetical protein Metho_2638 (plasmid) [Methanomethylovorans hollandica DSM 15978]|jgi:hypothetical protein|uniref:Molecular chaperone (Small heat shock protein) n=1 Tax=Methanomethylovorans hollandica (strain DSM 15978 / NBRC 107637 / DMS1) TaxID=867904 RepID=L0L2Y2_METHD|nr:Hsp20/alpha crystallin family protein [Methanomethylovorans hollandica]AGB50768.1 hypothetical protein Metho_2638 [Methanomethylovorans hollandica DSM 15978]
MVHKVVHLSIITVALIKLGAIVITLGRTILMPGEGTPPIDIKLSIPLIDILKFICPLIFIKRGYSIHNNDSMITIFINISGIPKDRIILDFTDDTISVTGSFNGKSICHNIPLPCKIDIDKISYIFNNGILEINCPKQITNKKTIKVQ